MLHYFLWPNLNITKKYSCLSAKIQSRCPHRKITFKCMSFWTVVQFPILWLIESTGRMPPFQHDAFGYLVPSKQILRVLYRWSNAQPSNVVPAWPTRNRSMIVLHDSTRYLVFIGWMTCQPSLRCPSILFLLAFSMHSPISKSAVFIAPDRHLTK
jgi:hypothetical protein